MLRPRDDAVDVWESWVEDDGSVVVCTGVVGGPSTVERREGSDASREWRARRFVELYGEGFRPEQTETDDADEDRGTVLVQLPPSAIPEDEEEIQDLWDRLETWVDHTLSQAGLGRCTGVDFSSEMTAIGDTHDGRASVDALVAALSEVSLRVPPLIAVRTGDGDKISWPPEQAGQELPA